jgi:hypothetical protein
VYIIVELLVELCPVLISGLHRDLRMSRELTPWDENFETRISRRYSPLAALSFHDKTTQMTSWHVINDILQNHRGPTFADVSATPTNTTRLRISHPSSSSPRTTSLTKKWQEPPQSSRSSRVLRSRDEMTQSRLVPKSRPGQSSSCWWSLGLKYVLLL